MKFFLPTSTKIIILTMSINLEIKLSKIGTKFSFDPRTKSYLTNFVKGKIIIACKKQILKFREKKEIRIIPGNYLTGDREIEFWVSDGCDIVVQIEGWIVLTKCEYDNFISHFEVPK